MIYRQVLDFEFSRRNVFRGAATNCCIPAIPQFYIDSRLRGSPPPIELHAASTKPIPKAAAVCYRSANGFFFFFFSRPLGLRFGLCLFFSPISSREIGTKQNKNRSSDTRISAASKRRINEDDARKGRNCCIQSIA